MTDREAEAAPGWPALSIAEAHGRLTAAGARFELETLVIRGVPTRVWKNAPASLRDVFSKLVEYRERTCLVYEDERATYAGFMRATLLLAQQLQAAGVQPGERVALAMRNLPEWPVIMFAVTLIGAIVVPMNAWGTGAELVYALRSSGALLLFADGERMERIALQLAAADASSCQLRAAIVTRAPQLHAPLPIDIQQLSDLIGASDTWQHIPERPLPDVALDPDADAMIFFTSGTTGKPKGAVCTQRNVCSNTFTTACAQARAALRRGQEPAAAPGPSSPQKTLLLAVPLFHVMGCMPWLVAGLYNGSKLVLMHKWDATLALSLIERERITQAGGVPMMAAQLLEHPQRARYDLSSLESISMGGAPAAKVLAGRLRESFPQARAANGWGMTEVTSSFASNQAEDYLARPDSCGLAAPCNDWKIVSEDGEELPLGQIGELWVKGPQVVRGYWNDPDATRESFADGWLKTGDIAYLDNEGFCYLVDRAKDMLIRGGENIYCVEVENVLHDHPAVLDVAVVGLAHEQLGEVPAAVVQLRPGAAADSATETTLREHARSQLASFKVPTKLRLTHEALPRNAAGKLLKAELRSWFDDV